MSVVVVNSSVGGAFVPPGTFTFPILAAFDTVTISALFSIPPGNWTSATWKCVGQSNLDEAGISFEVTTEYVVANGDSVQLANTNPGINSGEVAVSAAQLIVIHNLGILGGANYLVGFKVDGEIGSLQTGNALPSKGGTISSFTLTLTGTPIVIQGAPRLALGVANEADVIGSFVVKPAQIVNIGDLVGVDHDGLVVVASRTSGGIVPADGIAFFNTDNSPNTVFVGDGVLRCTVARKAKIKKANIDTTLLPGYARGAKIYLGHAGVSLTLNYTCFPPSVGGEKLQLVGYVDGTGDLQISVTPETARIFQAAALSNLATSTVHALGLSSYVLREDGSYLLREDSNKFVRES